MAKQATQAKIGLVVPSKGDARQEEAAAKGSHPNRWWKLPWNALALFNVQLALRRAFPGAVCSSSGLVSGRKARAFLRDSLLIRLRDTAHSSFCSMRMQPSSATQNCLWGICPPCRRAASAHD